MKKKYYAVKNGSTVGIFQSWEECKNATDGYPRAQFKSFSTKKEAEAYLSDGESRKELTDLPPTNEESPPGIVPFDIMPVVDNELSEKTEAAEIIIAGDSAVAYVDGSYDVKTGRYSFGCVILTPDKQVFKENGVGDNKEAKTARNVAGELMGAMFAIKFAVNNGYKNLTICHDYTGIAKWYEKKWKASSYCAVEYVNFIEDYRNIINVSFKKIEAHTGVFYNEEADKLAKEALNSKE